MSLLQSLTAATTVFAFIVYTVFIVVSLPVFETIHEKLEHSVLQYAWDKIGMPVLRTLLLLLFLFLVYPLNFGLSEAPTVTELLAARQGRFDFLFNIIFLITFIYPVIPVIGKADAFMIPLQGLIASALIFRWLCQQQGLGDYSLLPSSMSALIIVVIAAAGYLLARIIAQHAGAWLDNITNREGYRILVYQAVLMIMQSPIIFLFGHALGKQLIR